MLICNTRLLFESRPPEPRCPPVGPPVLQMVAWHVATSDSRRSPRRSLRSRLLLAAPVCRFSPGVISSQISPAPVSMYGWACNRAPATCQVMSSPWKPAQSEAEHSGVEAPPGCCPNKDAKVGADHTHIFRLVHSAPRPSRSVRFRLRLRRSGNVFTQKGRSQPVSPIGAWISCHLSVVRRGSREHIFVWDRVVFIDSSDRIIWSRRSETREGSQWKFIG
jgi:hypothetical protein